VKKILIIGGSGLLGSALQRELISEFTISSTYFSNGNESQGRFFLNVHDELSTSNLLQELKPDYVINCAGLTNVEDCERHPERAMRLNAKFPAFLAKLCAKHAIKLTHVSTDHFNSDMDTLRDESMTPVPVNRYGYSKLIGETLVRQIDSNALILRTNFFGLSPSGNHSLLDFAVTSLLGEKPLFGFKDVVFTPVGVTLFARTLTTLLDRDVSGILNLCGTESLTKLSFLKLVAEEMGFDPSLICPSTSTEHRTEVNRPVRLSLNNSRLLGFTGELPSLKHMIRVELRKSLTH
jgi:dTDP-4-dehydrorhamnose reductase